MPGAAAGASNWARALKPFVSYAQNFEDVVLWRALQHVENGFYIDVGAADPVEDSVTRAFYDRGWSGINIEPTEEYYARLVADRPRDVNLRVLAGANSGMGTIHIIPDTGLSTVDADFAAREGAKGRQSRSETLPIITLDGLLQSHGDRPIHFLKIDVEGAERAVLEGIDLARTRPWVVLVEATEPNTQVRTEHLWEELLLDREYTFALFDGLNCFYVANEHASLRDELAVPPNVFDNFLRFSEHRLTEKAARIDAELQRLVPLERSYEALLGSLPEIQNLQADRDGLARQAQALEASRAELMAIHAELQAKAARLANELDETRTHFERALDEARAREATLLEELTDARVKRIAMAERLAQMRATLQQAQHDLAGRDVALAEVRGETANLSHGLAIATAERLRLRAYADASDQRIADWQTRFGEVFKSTSWRITAPMRLVGLLVRSLRGRRTNDLEAHLATLPALPPRPPAAEPLVASDSMLVEAELRRAALPERAKAILLRLEVLARNESSEA
jgi:FkbM family methyltransferase